MSLRWLALLLLAISNACVAAQSARPIRISVDFRQSCRAEPRRGSGRRLGVHHRAGARARPRGGVGAESTERRVRRSSGIFTLVQDGGESLLTVATEIPIQQVAFYRDYATGGGHRATGVTFRDVGTSLKIQASLVAGNQIRVRLTPRVSYGSPDGSGVVEFTEAATELVVPSGRPVMLGGDISETHAILRQMLGVVRERSAGEATVVLTATAQ